VHEVHREISPLETATRSAHRHVKKFFGATRSTILGAIFALKCLLTRNLGRTAAHRISAIFLSTKKCQQFAGEKIDGVWATTISSALGSGQPHPVVVSNV
jgi:hypothetical protein